MYKQQWHVNINYALYVIYLCFCLLELCFIFIQVFFF